MTTRKRVGRFTFNKTAGEYIEELGWCSGYWELGVCPWLQIVRLASAIHIHFLGSTLYINWEPTKWVRWDRKSFPNFGAD